ncbi:hypothetical protein Pan216_57360 [Planctomycetes bacterium Pan216]|uniref:DUF3592 domain-containing protein n=1 Tax=Kolteria novifilia TaxID=2527975 RepID=A0A518BD57_9BACT|nr:hypothetical protein Pan216_57360 [Planctomycetes bacterium Pan216]
MANFDLFNQEGEAPNPDTRRQRVMRTARSTGGVGGWCGVLFGLVFAGAGTGIILLACDVIGVEGKKNAPDWVIGAVGGVFALAGLWVIGLSIRSMIAQRRHRQMLLLHPEENWLADFAWDRQGAKGDTLKKAFGSFCMSLFLMIFLAPFNWWAFLSDDGPWPVKIGIGLLDLGLVAMIGGGVYYVLRWLKYGTSYVSFRTFPYFLGEEMPLVVGSTRPISNIRKRTFTIRCIEEKQETTRRKGKTQTQVVCYQLYAETQTEDLGDQWSTLETEKEVIFKLPAGDYETNLSGKEPRYWVFETHAETPGIDHAATFLIPVYAKATSEGLVFGGENDPNRSDS